MLGVANAALQFSHRSGVFVAQVALQRMIESTEPGETYDRLEFVLIVVYKTGSVVAQRALYAKLVAMP